MRNLITACIVAAIACSLVAQEQKEPQPNAASRQYHEFREKLSEPSYGLSKIKALIKKIKTKETEDGMGEAPLTDAAYNALTVEERFTYTMIHGEVWSQNCDVSMPVLGEEKKIFRYFPSPFGGEQLWSERQKEFMKKNRVKVMALIKETMNSKRHMGVNLKAAVLEINAIELIPDMVKLYNRDHKDHDILTVLMNLMADNKYAPFMVSASYKKLFAEGARYDAYLDANSANQKLTTDRAMAFYKSVKK